MASDAVSRHDTTMRPTPILLASALVTGALLAHGCATVSSAAMVPDRTVEVERALGGAVRVEASGSPRRGFVGRSLVSGDELTKAVRMSVMQAGLFDEIAESGDADQVLTVAIEHIEEPEVGLDQTCEVALRWRLSSGDRSRTIWEELITTRETVTTYQEIDSHRRTDRAIQEALQANLRRGITKLGTAKN